MGSILSVADLNGSATTYDYDNLDRISKVWLNGKKISYSYDDNGNVNKVERELQAQSIFAYDKNDRMLDVINKKSDYDIISTYSYNYDLAGRTISKTDLSGQTGYTYDDIGRVVGVQVPDKMVSYQYDESGNRSLMTETYAALQGTGHVDEATQTEIQFTTKTNQYSFSDANKLMSLTEVWSDGQAIQVLQDITAYTYDNNRNEIASVSGWISTQSVYDGFNRLSSKNTTKDSIATTVDFVYNGDDLRVERTVISTEAGSVPEMTKFLYDRQNVLLTTDDLGNTKERLIIGNGYEGRIDDQGTLSFCYKNGHGDIVQTVGLDGSVQNQYDYDIFGNTTFESEQYPFQIRYAGEYYDEEAGLYYLRARHYNPSIGRFVTEDTYLGESNQPSTPNLYTYCINNPLSYVDPSGHRAMVLTQGSTGIEAVEQVNEINSSASEPVVAPTVQDIVGQSQTTTIGEMAIANGYVETVAIGTGGTDNEALKENTNSDGQINVTDKNNGKETTSNVTRTSSRRPSFGGRLDLDSESGVKTGSGLDTTSLDELEIKHGFLETTKTGVSNFASHPIETATAVGGLVLGTVGLVGSGAVEIFTAGTASGVSFPAAVLSVNTLITSASDLASIGTGNNDKIGDVNLLRTGTEGLAWAVGEGAEKGFEFVTDTDVEIGDKTKFLGTGAYYIASLAIETRYVAKGFGKIANKDFHLQTIYSRWGNITEGVNNVSKTQKAGAAVNIVYQTKAWYDNYLAQ